MKEELKIFESILPRNPVKAELSNIFMDKEYIVAIGDYELLLMPMIFPKK